MARPKETDGPGQKLPWIRWYYGDYMSDSRLAACSLATRGAWMDILMTMHERGVGQVDGTIRELARICRCESSEMVSVVAELAETGTADVQILSRYGAVKTFQVDPDLGLEPGDNGRDMSRECHADVTRMSRLKLRVISRRVTRSSHERKGWRERQLRRRSGGCHGSVTPNVTPDVTPMSRECHALESESESESESSPPLVPPGGKTKTGKAKTGTKARGVDVSWTVAQTWAPSELQVGRFGEAWDEWVADRSARRKPLSKRAAQLQLAALGKHLGLERSIDRIERAIQSGWQGLVFEEDKDGRTERKQTATGRKARAASNEYDEGHANIGELPF